MDIYQIAELCKHLSEGTKNESIYEKYESFKIFILKKRSEFKKGKVEMKVECRGLFRLSGQRKEWEGVRA